MTTLADVIAHRDAMFEVMRAYGIDIDNHHCPDDVCDGGRGCPRSEECAIEVFSDLWEAGE